MTEPAIGSEQHHPDLPDGGLEIQIPEVDVPEVDVPEVLAAAQRLRELGSAAVHDHPQIYDDVQRLLTAALDPQHRPGQPTGR